MNYEIIGVSGTLMILAAFLCNTERMIRILDACGAVLFVIYGFFIKSPSTVILNTVLIIIQCVKLIKMKNKEVKCNCE